MGGAVSLLPYTISRNRQRRYYFYLYRKNMLYRCQEWVELYLYFPIRSQDADSDSIIFIFIVKICYIEVKNEWSCISTSL